MLHLSMAYINLTHNLVFPLIEKFSLEILSHSHHFHLKNKKTSVFLGKLQPELGFSPPLLLALPQDELGFFRGSGLVLGVGTSSMPTESSRPLAE